MKQEKPAGLTVVVKVEIKNLLEDDDRIDQRKFDRLVRTLSNIRNRGIHLLVVSSGAIFLGEKHLGLASDSLEKKQALAAVGQVSLMELYQQYFNAYDQITAQILYTEDVVDDPVRNLNIRNTLFNLLSRNVITIINENDSVSTEDIELDDNYYLVRRTAALVTADALVVHLAQDRKYLVVTGPGREDSQLVDAKSVTDYLFSLSGGVAGGPHLRGGFPDFLSLPVLNQSDSSQWKGISVK